MRCAWKFLRGEEEEWEELFRETEEGFAVKIAATKKIALTVRAEDVWERLEGQRGRNFAYRVEAKTPLYEKTFDAVAPDARFFVELPEGGEAILEFTREGAAENV